MEKDYHFPKGRWIFLCAETNEAIDEPWITFYSFENAKSPQMVPGIASNGLVFPMMRRETSIIIVIENF